MSVKKTFKKGVKKIKKGAKKTGKVAETTLEIATKAVAVGGVVIKGCKAIGDMINGSGSDA